MIDGVPIHANAVYDDAAIQVSLGIGSKALSKARRSGELQFSRKGRRILYLGQWVLDWLETDAARATGVSHDE